MTLARNGSPWPVLVKRPGLWYLTVSFLARLPWVMGQTGILTLLVGTGHSYALAGLCLAVMGCGTACVGPVVGRLADLYGQRRIGAIASALDAGAYAGLAASVVAHTDQVVIVMLACAAGMANPQVTPFSRVRWFLLFPGSGNDQLIAAGFAYESVADEFSFILGPAFAGVLALGGIVVLPLVVTAVLLAAFGVMFALHATGNLAAPTGSRPDRVKGGAISAQIIGLCLSMACIGAVFGATQTGVSALAKAASIPGSTGLIYSAMGMTSAGASVVTSIFLSRFSACARLVWCARGLFACTCGLLIVGSVESGIIALAILGLAVSPFLITVYTLTMHLAPPDRRGSTMTVVGAGSVLGSAVGATAAGWLADSGGFHGAFRVATAAGLCAAVVSAGYSRRIRQKIEE